MAAGNENALATGDGQGAYQNHNPAGLQSHSAPHLKSLLKKLAKIEGARASVQRIRRRLVGGNRHAE